jgi:hypothetical protein
MTVIDFESKAFWKQLERRFDLLRTDIDYAGITRHTAAANETANDPITLEPATATAIRTLFSRYGFPDTPQTWAEFRAVHAYIEQIEEAVDTLRVGYAHIPQHGLNFLRKHYADVYEVVMFILEDDFDKVVAFHQSHGTFERLVADYDELEELPDPDPDKFRSSAKENSSSEN